MRDAGLGNAESPMLAGGLAHGAEGAELVQGPKSNVQGRTDQGHEEAKFEDLRLKTEGGRSHITAYFSFCAAKRAANGLLL